MKYNYLSYLGWYLFIAIAGFGVFILYSKMVGLYLSVIVGCLISALGSKIIPPLKEFKIETRRKKG